MAARRLCERSGGHAAHEWGDDPGPPSSHLLGPCTFAARVVAASARSEPAGAQEAAEALAAMEAGLHAKAAALAGELAGRRATLGELERRRGAVAGALAEGARALAGLRGALCGAQESLALKQSLLADKDIIVAGLRARVAAG
jgi:hypothetical protein